MSATRFFLLFTLCTMMCACAPTRFDNPIATMLNRDAGYNVRRQAAAQAEREMYHDPARLEALEKITWDRGYPDWQRQYAIDQLVALDEARFRELAARRFVLFQDWNTIKYVFDLAVERNWQEFTAVAVRNYVRTAHGISDMERIERGVIEKLNPGRPVEDVIFEVFANEDGSAEYKEQVAAWELINRLVESEKVIALLRDAPGSSRFVSDLRRSAAELHAIPHNREGVLWLEYLLDPARQAVWDRYKQAVSQLLPAQRQGLEFRHLPVLVLLDADTLTLDREQLLISVQAQIRGGEHHLHGPSFDGPMADYEQQLHAWSDKMSWADLATVRFLFRMMHTRGLVDTLFRQADADLEDTSTEYGGVIDESQGSYRVTLYKPMIRHHDRKFIPRDEMINHLYTGLAHYHFHAQEHRNASYAGPGVGDLRVADGMHFNYLVFTFIDRNRLNVDYYQRDGVVIDLTTIRR